MVASGGGACFAECSKSSGVNFNQLNYFPAHYESDLQSSGLINRTFQQVNDLTKSTEC